MTEAREKNARSGGAIRISDSDREILLLFCKKAREISNSSIFREKKYKTSVTMKWRQGEGLLVNVSGPEKEALLALVTSLRQCYAQKERINFRRIKNIVWKYVRDGEPRVKECVISAEEEFNRILSDARLPMEFQVGGQAVRQEGDSKSGVPLLLNGRTQVFAPKAIIDVWFNANIFHADIEKGKIFEEILRSPFAAFFDFVFKTAIMELSRVIIYFGRLIEIELFSQKPMQTT